MIDDTKILTLHPKGKKGINILRRGYDIMKDFIVNTVEEKKEISHKDLNDLAIEKLTESYDGKAIWFFLQ